MLLLRQQSWDENNLFKPCDMSGRSADALYLAPQVHLRFEAFLTVPSKPSPSLCIIDPIRRSLCTVLLQQLLRAAESLTPVTQEDPAVHATTSHVSEVARGAYWCVLASPGDGNITRSVFFTFPVPQEGTTWIGTSLNCSTFLYSTVGQWWCVPPWVFTHFPALELARPVRICGCSGAVTFGICLHADRHVQSAGNTHIPRLMPPRFLLDLASSALFLFAMLQFRPSLVIGKVSVVPALLVPAFLVPTIWMNTTPSHSSLLHLPVTSPTHIPTLTSPTHFLQPYLPVTCPTHGSQSHAPLTPRSDISQSLLSAATYTNPAPKFVNFVNFVHLKELLQQSQMVKQAHHQAHLSPPASSPLLFSHLIAASCHNYTQLPSETPFLTLFNPFILPSPAPPPCVGLHPWSQYVEVPAQPYVSSSQSLHACQLFSLRPVLCSWPHAVPTRPPFIFVPSLSAPRCPPSTAQS